MDPTRLSDGWPALLLVIEDESETLFVEIECGIVVSNES
jgi:hypothetical protein